MHSRPVCGLREGQTHATRRQVSEVVGHLWLLTICMNEGQVVSGILREPTSILKMLVCSSEHCLSSQHLFPIDLTLQW